MRRTTRLLPAIILPTLLGPISAQAGEAEMVRVKAEWPAAARRLDEMFAQVRGTARLSHEDPHATAKLPRTEARFAIDHGMEKVELSRFTQDYRPVKLADIVYCVGEGTAFRLFRRAGDELYIVQGIGTTPSDRYSYVSLFGRFVLAHHGVEGLSMSRFLESPGFEVIGAEALNRAGKNLIKVDCVSGPRASKGQISLVLEPDAGWIVRSCRYRPGYEPGSLFHYEIEYGTSRGGVPLPRRVKLEEPGGIIHHCEFTDWVFAPTPVSEFNMVHYGLPDLVHAYRPRNTLPYWLAGLALLVGSIALVLWRLASRGAPPSRA